MPKFMEDRTDDTWTIKRRKIFEDLGYECLFLNVREIDKAIEKVQIFIHNGLKVINKEEVTLSHLKRLEKNKYGHLKVYDIKLKEGANVFFVGRLASHNCASAISSSSFSSEMIKNMKVDDAVKITNKEIASALSLPPVKLHCSMLAEDAIKAAVDDYKKKQKDFKVSLETKTGC
jgi:nitrogen fixation NifU-like protein